MSVIIVVLNVFVCLNILIMAGLLWFRKNNTWSNILLGMFLFYAAVTFVNNILTYTNSIYYFFPLVYINTGLQLLTGPTLLLYFKEMVGKRHAFKINDLVHVTPAVLVILYGIQQGFISAEAKMEEITAIQNGVSAVVNFFNLLLLCHALVYFTVSWFILKKRKKEAESFFTHADHTKIGWSQQFLKVLITINIACIVGYGLQGVFYPEYYVYTDMIFLPVVSFPFYFFILVQAFNNHTVFTRDEYEVYSRQLEPLHTFLEQQEDQQQKQNATLKEQSNSLMEEQLRQLFEEEELYANKELNLQRLAQAIGISAHQLSFYINQNRMQNFSDFVNSYRVEKAKILLTDEAYNHFSVEGIGQECGFNTRSTFYAAFRKHVGNTPTGYKKEFFSKSIVETTQ